MYLLPYLSAYFGIGLFLIAVVVRCLMWARMPLHVRWELYPVAHDAKRAHYGGSYLEETDWWKKPREASLWGELKVMVPEILFLVALKEHNFRLWLRSFPFHFGVYLVIISTALMMLLGVLGAVVPDVATAGFASFLRYAALGCGGGGLALGLFGALGLLHRRLTDHDLKAFTTPADLFNLVLFIVVFGVALTHLLVVDRDLSRSLNFVGGLVTLKTTMFVGGQAADIFTGATVGLLSLLVAYIPMTHMSHFVGKYFAFHAIRWNDAPNIRGGKYEKPIHKVLGYPVSWSASHINADGKKSWVDLATEEQKK